MQAAAAVSAVLKRVRIRGQNRFLADTCQDNTDRQMYFYRGQNKNKNRKTKEEEEEEEHDRHSVFSLYLAVSVSAQVMSEPH